MNLRISKIVFSVLALMVVLTSCGDDDEFTDTPHLEWREHEFVDTTGNRRSIWLTTYFTDGDGNIGRDSNDIDCETANYEEFINNYDLFIYYFEQTEGVYQEIFPVDSCLPFHVPLPSEITPEGQNKTLEGTLSVTFSYNGFPQNNNVDSVKFEMQLKDRDGNLSERIQSPAIFVPPL